MLSLCLRKLSRYRSRIGGNQIPLGHLQLPFMGLRIRISN